MKKTILILAAAAMTSCGIYDRFSGAEHEDVTIIDDIEVQGWKELFTDSKLQELIETALDNNKDIQTAFLKTQEAEFALKSTRLGYFPTADLSASIVPDGGEWTSTVKGVASWEIDAFGKVTNEKRIAEASLEESREYAQAVRTMLIATVAQSYYNLLMLDKKYEISLETLDNWDKSIATLETLKKAGKSNDIAVLQARAKRMNLVATSLTLGKNIKTAESALCNLAGISTREIDRGEWSVQPLDTAFAAGVPVATVSSRPDVRQAEYALAQAFYSVNSARSAFYPTLKISADASWSNIELDKWVTSLIGSLTQPVFNKARNISNLKIAKAKQEEAAIAYRQCLLDAAAEVNESLISLKTSRERTAVDTERINELENALSKIELMMKYSTTNYLEVLTAQQSLLDAQMDLVQDMYDQTSSLISLYHSIGGGSNK